MTENPFSYSPADSRISVAALTFLHSPEGEKLRQLIADTLPAGETAVVSQVAALRKNYPVDAVHAALSLWQLQKKAKLKFPQLDYVWVVPEALEQATDSQTAAHKAINFAWSQASHIIDFCAGIGGDTLALANVAPVTAVDMSSVRTQCLTYNAQPHPPRFPMNVFTGKIEDWLSHSSSLELENAFIHVDPSRRTAGKRSPLYEDLIPGPALLDKIFQRFPNGALKLSPAVDFDSLPSGHLEILSNGTSCTQAVLWRGELAKRFPPKTRTASIVFPSGGTHTFTCTPMQTRLLPFQSLSPPPKYLYEVDPAFTRSGLAQAYADTGNIRCSALTVDAGYLVSDHLVPSPALTPFQVHAILPFSESRVTEALLKMDAPPGAVEVKSRNAPLGVDANHLQRLWSKTANRTLTVLLFRHEKETLAAIATRLPA